MIRKKSSLFIVRVVFLARMGQICYNMVVMNKVALSVKKENLFLAGMREAETQRAAWSAGESAVRRAQDFAASRGWLKNGESGRVGLGLMPDGSFDCRVSFVRPDHVFTIAALVGGRETPRSLVRVGADFHTLSGWQVKMILTAEVPPEQAPTKPLPFIPFRHAGMRISLYRADAGRRSLTLAASEMFTPLRLQSVARRQMQIDEGDFLSLTGPQKISEMKVTAGLTQVGLWRKNGYGVDLGLSSKTLLQFDLIAARKAIAAVVQHDLLAGKFPDVPSFGQMLGRGLRWM